MSRGKELHNAGRDLRKIEKEFRTTVIDVSVKITRGSKVAGERTEMLATKGEVGYVLREFLVSDSWKGKSLARVWVLCHKSGPSCC